MSQLTQPFTDMNVPGTLRATVVSADPGQADGVDGSAQSQGAGQAESDLMASVEALSESLCDKFEEIRIIHDLTDRLQLEESPAQTCSDLLEQLTKCVECVALIIQLDSEEDDVVGGELIGIGDQLSHDEVGGVVEAAMNLHLQSLTHDCDTIVLNHGVGDSRLEGIRVVVLPIQRGDVQLGRLIALRNLEHEEFGTVEVDLLRSVLMVLSLHLMNQRQYNEMQSMLEGTVRSLAAALDAKDAYTHGHSSRVAELAGAIASRLGLGNDTIEALQLAGVLHDIGKIGIDDSVLKKPGDLTDEEFCQIKQHPVIGYEILKDIRPFRSILPAVRHHHESWDGSGYPDGLAGSEIPRDAQILAVADAFDAMVSDRPYRKGMPLERVKSIFANGRNSQWAADVVDVLLKDETLMEEFACTYQTTNRSIPDYESANEKLVIND